MSLAATNIDSRYSTINHIAGDQHNYYESNGTLSGTLEKLRPTDMDAHDRAECLPGTRTDLIQLVMNWSLNPVGAQNVMWLHGVAGAGKSTLCTTVVNCLRDRNCLGAFVFFDRSVTERSNSGTVIRTLAYQLGLFNAEVGQAIAAAIVAFPSICQSPLSAQFQKLLLQPLSSRVHEPTPIVLVLDALDECGTPDKRELLLEILAEQSAHLPVWVRVIVTSRSEHDICCAFEERDHVLEHKLDITTTANICDISSFLSYRMARIRSKTRGLKVPSSWPTEDDILRLTERASGLFVWASTALKFIDGYDPRKRMDVVLRGDTGSGAEGALDVLYRTALESAGSWDDLEFVADFTAVMGVVLVARRPISCDSIDRLLASPEGRSCMYTIHHLGCVLQQDPTVRLLHPSFGDFLCTQTRCSRDLWFFDRVFHNHNLALHCMRHLDDTLHRNMCNLSLCMDLGTETLSDDVAYACVFWIDHVCAIKHNPAPATELMNSFLGRHLIHWFEAMSILKRSRDTIELLECLSTWLVTNASGHASLLELVREARRFAQTFATTVAEHPLLVYFSALPFTPVTSMLHVQYHDDSMPYIAGGFEQTWSPLLLVLADHNGGVNSTSFSPDGTRIVSGSADQTIRIWDAKSGAQILPPMRGHDHWILTVAFSPDGDRIVSGSTDKTLQIWDANTGVQVLPPLRGHEGWIWSAVFSSDGSRIISGSNDETVRVWDAKTGTEVLPAMRGHEGQIYCVAISPDDTRIISGSTDETIRLWDAHTGAEILPVLCGHVHWVQTVAFSPDGTQIVSGSDDNTIRIWDVKTGTEVIPPFRGHTDSIKSAVFSPDGTRIVSGSKDQTIRIWDACTGAEVRQASPALGGWVMSVAFSADGTRIISGSKDHTIRVWDARSGAEAGSGTEEGHKDAVRSVSWSPDRTRVVSGSYDQTVRVWDAQTGAEVLPALAGHEGSVWSVAFSADGSKIVSGSDTEVMQLWDAASGAELPVDTNTDDRLTCPTSPDPIVLTQGGWIVEETTGRVISKVPVMVDHLSLAAAERSLAIGM